ncbi:MAG: DUF4105 domain-containing protein [Gallionella sp.]
MQAHPLKTLLILLLLVVDQVAYAEPTREQSRDIAAMLTLAEAADLSKQAEWHKILQYHRVFGQWKSRVDDPSYFLAEHGKVDPKAEWVATIRNAFDDSVALNSPQPNVCRYIARYQFLSRKMKAMGFDFLAPQCKGFDEWRAKFSTHSVTLIFASIYLNSPASMYGHTFMRFDSEKKGSFNRLNDSTVSYAVGGNADDDPLFILKSMIGSYPGEFYHIPFYNKVREYSDLDSRDMWEYETNLNSEEIDHMLAFIWEHSFTYTDYYFADDNCALMLLASLEAARPSLELLKQAKPWLIPLDVVKLVRDQLGLVTEIRYRPSQFNNAQFNFYRADKKVQKDAVSLLDEENQEAVLSRYKNDGERAELLDISLAMLEYQRNRKHSAEDAEDISKYQLKLSVVRSTIFAESGFINAPRPLFSPDEGHDSFRAGLAYGAINSLGYGQLNFRASNHDGLDPDSGYAPGARSKMGDLYLRFNEKHVEFERLDIFEVFAPSIRSAWFSHPTIKFSASIQREVLSDNSLSPVQLALNAGAGVSYRLGEYSRAYVLAEGVMKLGDGNAITLGPSAGVVHTVTDSIRFEVESSAQWYVSGNDQHTWLYRVGGGIASDVWNKQNNVRLSIARQLQGNSSNTSRDFTDIRIAYFHYF